MVLWENIVTVRCMLKYLGVKCHAVCNLVLNDIVKNEKGIYAHTYSVLLQYLRGTGSVTPTVLKSVGLKSVTENIVFTNEHSPEQLISRLLLKPNTK